MEVQREDVVEIVERDFTQTLWPDQRNIVHHAVKRMPAHQILEHGGGCITIGEIDTVFDGVTRILREGASLGVHAVITGDRTLASNSRVSTMTGALKVRAPAPG